mmetsp:Transcript_17954/g.25151  ORF Transcript_17954/g.25151 Transcript_17954/m.25151 type:complete len:103 (-) Transcript_17954:42-350(-)
MTQIHVGFTPWKSVAKFVFLPLFILFRELFLGVTMIIDNYKIGVDVVADDDDADDDDDAATTRPPFEVKHHLYVFDLHPCTNTFKYLHRRHAYASNLLRKQG